MSWPLLHLLPSHKRAKQAQQRLEQRAIAYRTGVEAGRRLHEMSFQCPALDGSAYLLGVVDGWCDAERELLAWVESGVERLERYASEHGRAR